jgi:hypothetical protein
MSHGFLRHRPSILRATGQLKVPLKVLNDWCPGVTGKRSFNAVCLCCVRLPTGPRFHLLKPFWVVSPVPIFWPHSPRRLLGMISTRTKRSTVCAKRWHMIGGRGRCLTCPWARKCKLKWAKSVLRERLSENGNSRDLMTCAFHLAQFRRITGSSCMFYRRLVTLTCYLFLVGAFPALRGLAALTAPQIPVPGTASVDHRPQHCHPHRVNVPTTVGNQGR